MRQQTDEPAGEPTTLRPYRYGFVFSFTNAMTWMIALGTPMVLLAETLGASAFQVGLLYSFVFLLLPVQVLATAFLPRFGYKKQMMFGWTARSVFLLVPFGLAWAAPEPGDPVAIAVLLAAVFFFCFFRSMGSCAFQPWLYDLIPDKLKARYFGTDMTVIGVVGVLSLVFSAATFHYLEIFDAFRLQYFFAIVGSAIAIYALGRLPSVEKPQVMELRRIIVEGPRILLKKGLFRHYMMVNLVWVATGSAVVPFGVYYLRVDQALPQEVILFLTAVQSGGAIVGAFSLRFRLDRWGVRRTLLIAVGLNVIIYLFWLVMIVTQQMEMGIGSTLLFGLPVASFLLGVSTSGFWTTHMKYLAFVAHGPDRALRLSLLSSFVGFLTGLASIGWGTLFRKGGVVPEMNVEAFQGYFAAVIMVQLILIVPILRLREIDEEFEQIPNPRGMARAFRWIATTPLITPRGRPEAGPPNGR